MTKTIARVIRCIVALVAASVFALLVGCGDAHTFSLNPGHIQTDPDLDIAVVFDGAELELSRRSTRCEHASSKSLVTEVGDGMEFSAEQLSALDLPCPESPSPGVEVDLEGTSLVFDFSRVARAGRFPSAVFDGYVFHVTTAEDDLFLVAATVDSGASNVEVANAEVSNQPNRIDVNFEGASYDDDGFVKIDLWFTSSGLR